MRSDFSLTSGILLLWQRLVQLSKTKTNFALAWSNLDCGFTTPTTRNRSEGVLLNEN